MDAALAEIADAYCVRWLTAIHRSKILRPEFRDNVSGLGIDVFDIVGGWFATSFRIGRSSITRP